jgi:flagellar motor switch protein FliM
MSGGGQVLSNDEVAALVAAAQDGQAPSAETRPRRSRRVRTVDFTRPTKFSKDQQRRLELAHDTFCQTASTRLSAELRVPLKLEVIDVAQLTWTNALAEVPDPSVSAVVELDPHRTRMLLTAEMPFLLGLIERLLGGAATRRVPSRKLSDIDRALAGHVFTRLLDQLSVTWNDLADVTLQLNDLEVQTGTTQLAPLSEPTLCLSLEARLERDSTTMMLLVPYRAIEPIAAELEVDAYGQDDRDAASGERVREAMAPVEVQLRAEVAATHLTTEQVLGLRPGDVLRLGRRVADGVTVFADETPVYAARPGRTGRRRAVEVLERLERG